MKHSSRIFFALLVLVTLGVLPRHAAAQTATWLGSNGNWNAGADWSSGTAPGSGTNATIDSGTANLPASVIGAANVLTVGNSGTGAISVSGGSLSDASATVGLAVGSSGTVTLNAGGWTTSGALIIGGTGAGSVTVTGGMLGNGSAILGSAAGSSGTMAFSSGTWNTSGALVVGDSGAGAVTMTSGVLGDGSAIVGNAANSSGTMGFGGASWTDSGSLVVGNSGAGILNLAGGNVSSGTSYVGNNAGSSGSMSISSGGWSVGTVYVGNSGTGAMTINGGEVIGSAGVVGNGAGSSGVVNVSSGTWAENTIAVGQGGAGVLNLTGGYITDGTGYVGNGAASSGTVTISSGTWNSDFYFYVGNSGTGVLNLNGGALISTYAYYIGSGSGSNGTLNVTAGSFRIASTIEVGVSGTGTLNIAGTMNAGTTNIYAGYNAGSNGTINMNSGTWNTSGLYVTIGNSGTGTLNVNGGEINFASQVTVGENVGSYGTVNVTSGTLNLIDSALLGSSTLGNSGVAVMNINGGYVTGFVGVGGTLNVTSGTLNGGFAVYNGVVNISGSGVINTGSNGGVTVGQNAGTSGTINIGTGATLITGTIMTANGTGAIDFNETGTYVFSPNIATNSSIKLNQLGQGVTILTGSDPYFGATTISSGTLQVGNGGAAGLLAGSGVNNVNIFDNSSLALDRSGTLTVGSNISGTGSLQQIGPGVSVITGSNSYSGGTIISSGTLQVGVDYIYIPLGSGTVTNNAILAFDEGASSAAPFTNNITGAGSILNIGGSVVLTGTNTYGGSTVATGGVLEFGKRTALYNATPANWTAANITVQSGATLVLAVGGPGDFTSGDIGTLTALGSGSNGFENGSSIGLDTTDGNFTYNSVIANTNSGSNAIGLVETGSNMLVLTATETYSGPTTVSDYAGTLEVDGMLSGTGPVLVAGTLSGTGTVNAAVTLYGTLQSAGNLTLAGGVTVYSGQIASGTVTGNVTQHLDASLSVDGVLNGNDTMLDNTHLTGSGTISGTLTLGSFLTVSPASTLQVGSLVINGIDDTISSGTLAVTNTATVTSGAAVNLVGTLTAGQVVVNSGGSLQIKGKVNAPVTVSSGGILSGTGATGNVTVNSSGTLDGTLHSGAVTVNAGGTVMAGDAPGSNTMTSLSLSGSATYQEEIIAPGPARYTGPGNHPVAGTDYGQTTLTGTNNGVSETVLTLDPANSILRLNVTGTLPAGGVAATGGGYNSAGSNSSLDNYFILNLSDTADVISGKFTQATLDGLSFTTIDYSAGNLVGNSNVGTFTVGGEEWAITYTGDEAANSTTGGNDVALTALMAVPEPGSYALLAIGAMGMVVARRRRRMTNDQCSGWRAEE